MKKHVEIKIQQTLMGLNFSFMGLALIQGVLGDQMF
jgi:hypothetical protein